MHFDNEDRLASVDDGNRDLSLCNVKLLMYTKLIIGLDHAPETQREHMQLVM